MASGMRWIPILLLDTWHHHQFHLHACLLLLKFIEGLLFRGHVWRLHCLHRPRTQCQMTGMRPWRSASQAWMKAHPLQLMLLHSLQTASASVAYPSPTCHDTEKQCAQTSNTCQHLMSLKNQRNMNPLSSIIYSSQVLLLDRLHLTNEGNIMLLLHIYLQQSLVSSPPR